MNESSSNTYTAQGSKDEDIFWGKKDRRNSVIWGYFVYLKSDAKSTARCKLCWKDVTTKTGNTTNLFYHLKQGRSLEHAHYKTVQSQTQASAGVPPENNQRDTCASATDHRFHFCQRHKCKRHDATKHSWFKRLTEVFDSRYQPAGCKHFPQTAFPQLYTVCREKVKKELQSVTYFATTSDLWLFFFCCCCILLSFFIVSHF